MTLKLGIFTVTLHPEVGSGTFGSVYKATNNSTKELVAVKKIRHTNEDGGKNNVLLTMGFKEIKSTQSLNGNKNIIKFLEFQMDEHAFWIFMEFCELGDLHNYLKTNVPSQDKKIDIMYQCACAIDFMHSCNPAVVHRDIKTKNFLMKRENGKDVVKATDFGLAKLLEDGDNNQRLMSLYMTSFGGTYDYMAPDFFVENIRYKATVDIFSLGLVYLVVQQYHEGSPDTDLNPQSVGMRPQRQKLSVGYEMHNVANNAHNEPMPEVVVIEDSDRTPVRDIKELIKNMVVYDPKNRLPIRIVKERLRALLVHGSKETDERSNRRISDGSSNMANEETDSGTESGGDSGNDQAGYKLVNNMIKLVEKRCGGSMKMLPFGSKTSTLDSFRNAPPGGFKRYDTVKLQSDPGHLEAHQRGHGGYSPEMAACIGKPGIVTGANATGVRVDFITGDRFLFNPDSVVRVDTSGYKLEAGDYVLVKQERDVVEQIQKQAGSGGWIDDMTEVVGRYGIVRCVRGQKIKVEHKEIEKSYVWNSHSLVLVAKGEDILVHLMHQQKV